MRLQLLKLPLFPQPLLPRPRERHRDFASYEEALQYFLRTTNITNAMDHFADTAQRKLPFNDEEPIP
jgi:hypothetical protein